MNKLIRNSAISIVNKTDELLAKALIVLRIERKSLMIFLFHGIFKDSKERTRNIIDPQWFVTKDELRKFVEYYLENNYVFITPNQILEGLVSNKKYAFLTFDDGYFNNIYAKEVIKEYNIPATFFISSNYISENKSFWWDVIYREHLKRNVSFEQINQELLLQEYKKADEVEKNIFENFGKDAFKPVCDIDRPFTTAELKTFADDSLVILGNHTCNHAVLNNYPDNEIEQEMQGCQDFLTNLTGQTPNIISYPSGWYNENIVAIAKKRGLKLGLTVNEGKTYFPLDLNDLKTMMLNRFTPLAHNGITKQAARFRTDFHLKKVIKMLVK